MFYSYNWLRQFLNKIPPVEELTNKLTMSGLEVESVKKVYTDIHGILVATIEDIKPHPRADNLFVAKVSTGDKVFSTVTGAQGLVTGMKVAYAPPGATITNNRTIEEIEIKSERSSGMIVSEDELGIPGSLRKVIIFEESVPAGRDVKLLLGLDDWILDIGVTPNRSDVLSHFGLAREIATIFKLKVTPPHFELKEKKYDPGIFSFKVKIESAMDCPRYTLRLISGVKVETSPLWLRIMLGKLGQNTINNIVDITNYVMFGIGQPLHAFDRQRIEGNTIIIRRAKNEKLVTLDGEERLLSDQTLVIADEKKPIAIAGVMGGKDSGIMEDTSDVLLESALFSPSLIRKAERSLNLQTEADYRFERGIDPLLPEFASGYASYLISQMTGATVYKLIDNWAARYKKRRITTSTDELQTLIGFPVNIRKIQSILKSAYCDVKRLHPKTFLVIPPSFRLDITQAADLGEEIARLVGYDKIPSVLPYRPASNVSLPDHYVYTKTLKNYLISIGFDEVINYSFLSERDHEIVGGEAIRLLNPINEQTVLMRNSLIPGLIKTVQYNIFRQIEDQKLFEIGKVYIKNKSEYNEQLHLTGLVTGKRFPFRWSYPKDRVDVYDVIGIVEGVSRILRLKDDILLEDGFINILTKGCSAILKYNGENVGFVGEVSKSILDRYDIKQNVFVFDISIEPLFVSASTYTKYSAIPKYPFVARDLTIVKPVSLSSMSIINIIKSIEIPILVEIFPFDLYVDKNNISEHSITYRFIFRANDKTLTDEEVDSYMKIIMERITAGLNVRLKI
ncbi:MAG: phenylalanine--tRNA ligase subunit beta [bacterium]